MKKILGFALMFVLLFSSLALAGGDKVCGDKATGPAGDTGGGQTERTRTPAD